MIVVKKDFAIELNAEENTRFATVKTFMTGKGISILVSKEVVGKGSLGVDVVMWVLVMVKDQMIIKKDIQPKAVDLLITMEKMLTDYDYE
jgi:hypothetical protein